MFTSIHSRVQIAIDDPNMVSKGTKASLTLDFRQCTPMSSFFYHVAALLARAALKY